METVCVKFQEQVLAEVDKKIKDHNFNSRTEFIREAVRDKLEDLSRDEIIEKIMSFKGKFKHKHTTSEDEKRIKEEVFDELEKKFGLK